MIYIVLSVHDRLEETKKFVDCLLKQKYQDYQLILVDDGSTDGTAEFVKNAVAKSTILCGDGNLWWAGSLEKARKFFLTLNNLKADDIILIINNDVIFGATFLSDVLNDITNEPRSLILAKCFDQSTNELLDKGVHVDWRKFRFTLAEKPEDINVLSTRGLYMRYEVFKAIGKFHPILIPHYASDYEFTGRAYKKNFSLKLSPQTVIYLNQATTGLHEVDYTKGLRHLFSMFIFSKRSLKNVFTWTNYIILSCDFKYIPINLIRVYGHAFKYYLKWFKFRVFKIKS